MALNFIPLLIFTILSLALLFNFSAAAPGGWQPIENPNDPIVVEIGAFAVNEHNKEANERLYFQKVLNGEKAVVAGLKYKLVIAATRGGDTPPSNYEVEVLDVAWEHLRQLISFKKI